MTRNRRRRRAATKPRLGFGLIEMIVAMVVMAITITGLASMTFYVGRRSIITAGNNGRAAEEIRQADRLAVLPFDSLASRAGCTTINTTPYPHTRCVSVSNVTPRQLLVTVVFTPSSPLLNPDTVVFERSKSVPNNPLK